jgi:hypothetical protein
VSLPTLALAQPPDPANFPLTPVCDLHVDEDGDCITDAVGDEVCVRGIVQAWKQFGSRGPGAIVDTDSGCCLSIFDITTAPDLAVGVRVEVCGWVGNFAGQAEITDQPGMGSNDPVVTVLDATLNPVAPRPIACDDVADDNPIAEALESCLVQVCGQFLDDGNFLPFSANYDFDDLAGDTCEVRIDSDTGIEGTPIPDGPVAVTGILGQFNGFQDDCTGYQILPRALADFSPPFCNVDVDIKPQSCPNPFMSRSQGVVPVAILGSDILDIHDIDVSSLTLAGVAPIHAAVEDVSGPVGDADECDCTDEGPDGFDDLTLSFRNQDLAAVLGPVERGDVIVLTIAGSFLDGTEFEGSDCIVVRN